MGAGARRQCPVGGPRLSVNLRNVFAWGLVAGSAVVATSLEPTCSLEVNVEDGRGVALSGVEVTADAPMLFDARRGVTDAKGRTVVSGLEPGEYRLQLDLAAYQWLEVERVLCPPDGTVRLWTVLEAVEGDEVVILQSGPMVDAESQEAGWWLDRDELEPLPRALVGAPAMPVLAGTVVESAAGVGLPAASRQWQGRFLVDSGEMAQAPLRVVTRPPLASWQGEVGVQAGWGAAAAATGTRGAVSTLTGNERAFAAIGGGFAGDRTRLFVALEGGRARTSSEVEFGGSNAAEVVDHRQPSELQDVLLYGNLRWHATAAHVFGLRLRGAETSFDSAPSTLFTTSDSAIPLFDHQDAGGSVVVGWTAMFTETMALRLELGGARKTEHLRPEASGLLAQDQTAEGFFSNGFGNGIWSGAGGIARVDDTRRLFSVEGGLEWAAGRRHHFSAESGWVEDSRRIRLDPSGPGDRIFWRDGDGSRIEVLAVPDTVTGVTRGGTFAVSDRWRVGRNATLLLSLDFKNLDFDGGFGRYGYGLNPADTAGFGAGVVWDFEGRGRSRAWVNWSRSRPDLDEVIRLRLSGAFDIERIFDFEDDAVPPEVLPPGEVRVGSAMVPAVADDVTLGVEYEVLSDVAVGLAATHHRIGGGVASLSEDGGGSFSVGTPEGPLWPDALASERWQANAWARKRLTSSWQASLTLQWSQTRGTWSGARTADFAAVDREYLRDVVVPDALVNAWGPLPEDREWRVEILGSWTLNAGPVLGGRLRYTSGAPVSQLGALDGGFGLDRRFVDDRGSAGRTPELWHTDVVLSWPFEVGSGTLMARVEIRNLLNRQAAITIDERWSLLDETGAAGTDVLSQHSPGTWGQPLETQRPLEARFGFAYRW